MSVGTRSEVAITGKRHDEEGLIVVKIGKAWKRIQ